jgi:membrane associated rhomboid family serine protease
VTDQPLFDGRALLSQSGPLTRETAQAAIAQAAGLMATADFLDAARLYQRVIGVDDVNVTAAAMVGLGEALHRLDEDAQALGHWEAATGLPENEHTYAAWRNVAAARVRSGDLRGALAAYREADRRAPRDDKAEIASRMGWLAKEVGDRGASGRYFARARGDAGPSLALGIVAVTVATSLLANPGISPVGDAVLDALAMDKVAIANGELWRLWSVTLVHAQLTQMPLHLLFNMYLLYLAGPFTERLYGRVPFLLIYLAAAAGGSLATFAFSDARFGVGASGALFGLFGLLIAVQYVHRPMLDRGSRAFMGQFVGLVILNLILGFAMAGIVDNWAHIGGLLTGLWLGVLFAPGRVATMRSMWQRPGSTPGTTVPVFGTGGTTAVRLLGLGLLGAAMLVLWTVGSGTWS